MGRYGIVPYNKIIHLYAILEFMWVNDKYIGRGRGYKSTQRKIRAKLRYGKSVKSLARIKPS